MLGPDVTDNFLHKNFRTNKEDFLSQQDYWRQSSDQKETVQIMDIWLQGKISHYAVLFKEHWPCMEDTQYIWSAAIYLSENVVWRL